MFQPDLDRRRFLGGAASIGGLAMLPSALWARTPAALKASEAALADYVGSSRLAGAVISVGRGVEAADYVTRGNLALGSDAPVDADSLWRVYSMTKPVTGIAAMMLVGDGVIRLDQPIADFLPAYASMKVCTSPDTSLDAVAAKTPITVRHLLTHTAGLGYTIVTKGPLLQEYVRLGLTPAVVSRFPIPGLPQSLTAPSLTEFADRLATLPLMYEPGTRWSYSVSLDLMGRVIEIATGKPFDAFLQQRLFDPLGMKDTHFVVPAEKTARLTTNYGVVGTGLVPIDTGASSIYLDQPPFPFGGAGLVSSARDFDRFLAMLLGKGRLDGTEVMTPQMVALGLSNLLPAGTSTAGSFVAGQGFGAGGRVKIAADDTPAAVGTFGWGGAAGTIAWVDPARNLRVGGYAQYMPAESYPFSRDVGKAVYSDIA